mmetsp:Transcript_10346/g.47470  ORF Transcript_10346/g.47470 Transcript_10346/m.47470 type:complete len:477 (-) Transcript_10346:375-1805(-)
MIASSSSLSISDSSEGSSSMVRWSTAAARWADATASASALFFAAFLAAFSASFSSILRSALARSFLGRARMRSRISSSSSLSLSSSSAGASGAGGGASTGSGSGSGSDSSSEDSALAFFPFLPFFPPLPPLPPAPPSLTPFLRTYTKSSFTRLALFPIIFLTLGSLRGLPSSSMARTFFSLSSPIDIGRSPILLSLRKISARSWHLPRSPGTDSMAFFLALRVTNRCFPGRFRDSSDSKALPSTTRVTRLSQSDSGERSVISLYPRRMFSRFLHCAISSGMDLMALRSASRTLSCDNFPISAGSAVRELSLRMSVRSADNRATDGGSIVSLARMDILRLLTLIAHHVAGSTSRPPGTAASAESPPSSSNASSFRSPAMALPTSGHTGVGQLASCSCRAASACAFLSSASCCFLSPPSPPRRSIASSSFFLRFDRCVAVSPSGASGSISSSSSVSSSSDSPPRSILAASSSWLFLRA